MANPLPPEDLDAVVASARPAFESLRGSHLFLTGGTGFFGQWLLASLLHADAALSLGLRATVLTRSAHGFQERNPALAAHPAITLLQGDIRSFAWPREPHTHILHAATDSTAPSAGTPAYALAEAIVSGTQHVLRFARETGASRLLYVSSGAVYGRNLTGLTHITETQPTAPDPLLLQSSYDEAKRFAEHLCIAYAHGTALQPVIARCFAFVGPHLPLDAHFAIGNFLRDAMAGTPIHIRGDGTPLRSFLYMSDLAAWLWTLLASGEPNRAYNVGSDHALSIAELAHLVAATLRPGLAVQIDGTPDPAAAPPTYVPSIARASGELGLKVTADLAEALRKTAAWHGYKTTA